MIHDTVNCYDALGCSKSYSPHCVLWFKQTHKSKGCCNVCKSSLMWVELSLLVSYVFGYNYMYDFMHGFDSCLPTPSKY